jgi:hypothetical protein
MHCAMAAVGQLLLETLTKKELDGSMTLEALRGMTFASVSSAEFVSWSTDV